MDDPRTMVEHAEDRLVAAQAASDVAVLDELLHENLVWTVPDGSIGGKDVDLQAHRDGAYSIRRFDVTRREIDVLTPEVAVTRVLVDADGEPASGTIAYTRVWQLTDGRWQVRAAHLSMAG